MAFESGYKSILAAKLSPGETSLIVATVPSITNGRLYLKSWSQEEWISFTWVTGNTLTWLTRQLSQTTIPATSEGSGYTWTAWTTVRIVAMHDQITWWDMYTSDFSPSAWAWASIELSGTTYTREITPTEDFTINVGTVIPWMTYAVFINTWATAYTVTLGTNVSNPYYEDLVLTANKNTKMVFLATDVDKLELWGAKTAV